MHMNFFTEVVVRWATAADAATWRRAFALAISEPAAAIGAAAAGAATSATSDEMRQRAASRWIWHLVVVGVHVALVVNASKGRFARVQRSAALAAACTSVAVAALLWTTAAAIWSKAGSARTTWWQVTNVSGAWWQYGKFLGGALSFGAAAASWRLARRALRVSGKREPRPPRGLVTAIFAFLGWHVAVRLAAAAGGVGRLLPAATAFSRRECATGC